MASGGRLGRVVSKGAGSGPGKIGRLRIIYTEICTTEEVGL